MTWYVRRSLSCSSVLPAPTDNIFLECALDGNADFIISGDKQLLDIGVYKGIEIVSAKEFLLTHS
jgi:predicted nucleic acid-binding protein